MRYAVTPDYREIVDFRTGLGVGQRVEDGHSFEGKVYASPFACAAAMEKAALRPVEWIRTFGKNLWRARTDKHLLEVVGKPGDYRVRRDGALLIDRQMRRVQSFDNLSCAQDAAVEYADIELRAWQMASIREPELVVWRGTSPVGGEPADKSWIAEVQVDGRTEVVNFNWPCTYGEEDAMVGQADELGWRHHLATLIAQLAIAPDEETARLAVTVAREGKSRGPLDWSALRLLAAERLIHLEDGEPESYPVCFVGWPNTPLSLPREPAPDIMARINSGLEVLVAHASTPA